jgi:phenazine biosynthesis protein phzE
MTFQLPTGPFALLRREGRAEVEVFTGEVQTVARLADIPLPEPGPGGPAGGAGRAGGAGGAGGPATLALIPYRQVVERGFDCVDDAVPMECLRIAAASTASVEAVLAALPPAAPRVRAGRFEPADREYAEVVGAVLREEIGHGEGSNFVIHRVYEATVEGDPLGAALAAFGRLLRDERGAYWTFCVHTPTRTLVGATPERHVSVDEGIVMMNPISGTYRHPAGGPDRYGLLRFLADPKETDELYMVLDEELKMMATVAEAGGQVIGPYLKPMAHLHHTEYLLAGRSMLDVRDVLRETMFAPTVVGSPIENACRVVARRERRGRRYYGAVLALLGHDAAGRQTLDAPILIRTAEISPGGRLRIPVGATLVRHSTPAGEVAETYAKAAGILAAFGAAPAGPVPGPRRDPGNPSPLADDETVRAALAARNAHLARFWLDQRDPSTADPRIRGRQVLVIDAEDTFTGMLTHLLRALGAEVDRRDHRFVTDVAAPDLVVAGPGPGDPTAPGDPKMVALRGLIQRRLDTGRPLLGICLGHQLIAGLLGLSLHRREGTYQGVQRQIDFFGRPERVGFYSTFVAAGPAATLDTAAGPVEVSRDPATHEVVALRGAGFASVQFHPESVLTEHGIDLLRDLLTALLTTPAATG